MNKEKLEYISLLQPLFVDEIGWNVGSRCITNDKIGVIMSVNPYSDEVVVYISVNDVRKIDKKNCLLYPDTYDLWRLVKQTNKIYIQWVDNKIIRILAKEGYVGLELNEDMEKEFRENKVIPLVESNVNDFELLFMRMIVFQEGL
jgi:hypothetical protein